MRDLNPRPIYYFFRFLKTNSRRIRILLSISIFTYLSSSSCHFASAYKIPPKSNHSRRSYVDISIFSVVLTFILSRAVSRSTGQIFAVDRRVSLFNALFRGEPLRIAKFGLKILDTSFYGMVKSIFRYLELFGRNSRV